VQPLPNRAPKQRLRYMQRRTPPNPTGLTSRTSPFLIGQAPPVPLPQRLPHRTPPSPGQPRHLQPLASRVPPAPRQLP
jgi:hypothetical protein